MLNDLQVILLKTALAISVIKYLLSYIFISSVTFKYEVNVETTTFGYYK